MTRYSRWHLLVVAATLCLVVPAMPASAAAETVSADRFSRSVDAGWGNAETGGSYTLTRDAGMRVRDGSGVMDIPAGEDRDAVLSDVAAQDVDVRVTLQFPTVPAAGNGVFAGPMLRRQESGAHFLPRVRVTPDDEAWLSLLYVDGDAEVTTLAPEVALPFAVVDGSSVQVRAQVQEAGDTTELRARAWPAGSAEPADWQRTATSTAIPGAGATGLWGYVSSGSDSAQLHVDDLQVTSLGAPDEPEPEPIPRDGNPGAQLPLSYDVSDLPGPLVFVAKGGSDAAAGTAAAPLATVASAIRRAASGSHIVVRGGTYAEGDLTIPVDKSIDIVAYPEERVTFTGAQSFDSGWTAEGGLAFHAYTPRPVDWGSGLNNDDGFAKAVAQYPDQVWQGSRTLQQVLSKGEVAPGRFYVDAARDRVYLHAADQSAGRIQASSRGSFLRILGGNSSLRGIRVERFSSALGDYGVVRIEHTTDRTTPLSDVRLEDVEIVGSAMQAVQVLVADAARGGRTYPADIIDGVTFRNVTIADSNWMGIAANYVDHLLLDQVEITGSNAAGEFQPSPQSGALKTSRARHITVQDSIIADNNSHGLWFDQSNYDTVVAGNTITGNRGSGVFWEISDRLLMVDNFVSSPAAGAQAVKIAGASGVRLVNNTFVGGKDVLGIYTDSRSKPGCADVNRPLCASSYSSDRDTIRPRPATLDWMPRIDLMINNIVAYPNGSSYCGGPAAVCATTSNDGAVAPLESIFHRAGSVPGVPATVVDGNVYANGSGALVRAGGRVFSDVDAWASTLVAGPLRLLGSESASRAGNEWVNPDGSPTAALQAVAARAVPVPSDPELNRYVPAGTRQYGRLGQ